MSADPVSFGLALAELGAEIARNPEKALDAWAGFSADLAAAASDTLDRAVGTAGDDRPPSLTPGAKDRRFPDPSWDENPWFFGQRQAYLAWSKFMHNLGGAADLDERTAQKAAFAVGMIVDALAPTNFAASQPGGHPQGVRDRRREPARGAWRTSSTTWRPTAASPARSTPRRSSWASTWPPRPARSCSATTSWS